MRVFSFMNKKTKNLFNKYWYRKRKKYKRICKFIVKNLNLNVKIKFDKSKPDGVPKKF